MHIVLERSGNVLVAVVLSMCLFAFQATARAADEPVADAANPLPTHELSEDDLVWRNRDKGFSSFFDDASLGLRSIYYGRARDADNSGRGAAGSAGEIHVNAFGQGVDFRSGYAWDVVGFDITGQTNLGRGNGWSEVLLHKEPGNRDRSSVSLGQAALKAKLGTPEFGWEARAGFTPIFIGTLGTSGGLHPHAYRGGETKFVIGDFWLGYGWADRFRNEWDDTYRRMTRSWDQNRFGGSGKRISHVHSLGARYRFGEDKAGYVDVGVGEGQGYRRNAQAVISVPVGLGDFGTLTLGAYGIVAKDRNGRERKTEYHASGSAELRTGDWTFLAGVGHTRAPGKGEMNFRLTPWGNSDNRNFIQTWGQLDDFVWDGENVFRLDAKYEVGKLFRLPGLSVGVSYLYGWNAANGAGGKSWSWEFDYNVVYAVKEGRFKGLSLGVYAAHLRFKGNDFVSSDGAGSQNRNDVKVILSYSRTLEGFLRKR